MSAAGVERPDLRGADAPPRGKEAGEARVARDLVREVSRCGFVCFSNRCFAVRDTKTRTIHAPTFRDRVVHHAMIRVTGLVFESGALFHSCACGQGRGQHAAIATARAWTRRTDWYGKMDVRKFYESVDHQISANVDIRCGQEPQRTKENTFAEAPLATVADR